MSNYSPLDLALYEHFGVRPGDFIPDTLSMRADKYFEALRIIKKQSAKADIEELRRNSGFVRYREIKSNQQLNGERRNHSYEYTDPLQDRFSMMAMLINAPGLEVGRKNALLDLMNHGEYQGTVFEEDQGSMYSEFAEGPKMFAIRRKLLGSYDDIYLIENEGGTARIHIGFERASVSASPSPHVHTTC